MTSPSDTRLQIQGQNYTVDLDPKVQSSSNTVKINGITYALKGKESDIALVNELFEQIACRSFSTLDSMKLALQNKDKNIVIELKISDISQKILGKKDIKSAEKQFHNWLNSFNSGNKEQFSEFSLSWKNAPKDYVEWASQVFDRTQGFNIVKIVESSSTQIQVILQEQCAFQECALLSINIESEEPHHIIGLSLSPCEDPEIEKIDRMTEDEAIKSIDNEITDLAKQGKFSGVALIMKSRVPLISRAVGKADIESNRNNTLQTKFNLGSQNKMFTSVVILQLAEEGKINLEDPIGMYLKENISPEIAVVTIKQLLTHTGGTGGISGEEYSEAMNPKDYMKLSRDRKPEFPPGTDWQYSNYGFVLLGAIAEEVCGKNYYTCVQERICDKAEMKDTASYLKTEEVSNLATGYIRKRDGLRSNFDTLPLRGTPAGGGYSTPEDLNRFAEALLKGKLLSPDSIELISKPKQVVPPTETNPKGFNWTLGFMDGDHWFGHAGQMDGVNSELRIYPDRGYTVIVMANLDPPAAKKLAEFIDARLPA